MFCLNKMYNSLECFSSGELSDMLGGEMRRDGGKGMRELNAVV